MMNIKYVLVTILLEVCIVFGTHFRGGTITWRPWNATPSGSSAGFIVRERFSWNRGPVYCDDTTIVTKGLIGDSASLLCTSPSPATACSSWSSMSTRTYCTDYNVDLVVSSGEYTQNYTFPLDISFTIYYYSGDWFANLFKGGNSKWYVSNRINTTLRPDGYINTSPVAVTVPIIYKLINVQHVHVVQMADYDRTDTLRCRWATASGNINQLNECGGICSGVPNSNLIEENCTIVFTLNNAGQYAGVALQIEDYYTKTSPTPMSSVPLQFLFYGYINPACTKPPVITGVRPDRACIGTKINSNVTEIITVETSCPGQYIKNFITTTPIGMIKSPIITVTATLYQMVLSWVPSASQFGPEPFCAAAVDNYNLQSIQWCITFVVGIDSPKIIDPLVVQGTVSPVGTVFQNQSVFSFQTTKPVNRPTRNGTVIYFRDAANDSAVAQFDCGWEPEVTFTGYTTVVRFANPPWEIGHFYYVTMDSGVVSGTEFCGPESAAITDKNYWVFNIWNPAVSSTTTTTTTPFTTATVTTIGSSTTSVNTLLTTTGIVVTNTTVLVTSSTATAATTPAPTTAAPTASTATTEVEFSAISPKDFEEICRQPIAIMTSVMFIVMMPIHTAIIYGAFTKMEKMFNPSHIQARTRHKQRMKRIF